MMPSMPIDAIRTSGGPVRAADWPVGLCSLSPTWRSMYRAAADVGRRGGAGGDQDLAFDMSHVRPS